jgi:hypothetical protein
MKAIPIRKEPNMSLAETALQERAESAEPQVNVDDLPVPGKYEVESTGALPVPLHSTIEIEIVDCKGQFKLDDDILGLTLPLDNGDFAVHYEFDKRPARLQFRQTGLNAEYMFGVSLVFPAPAGDELRAMEDPPITGVWGAETRPPREEPYPAE